MRLPLLRPLRYADHPIVQSVRGDLPPDGPRVALLDDFDRLASDGFDPEAAHPLIRQFYTSTLPFKMSVKAVQWERWALPMGLIYVPLARRLNNLCVPDRVDEPMAMASSVHRLDLPEGQSRRWSRRFAGSGQHFYTAGFRSHSDGRVSRFCMAFPFGRLQLMVVMGLQNVHDGLVASTKNHGGSWLLAPGRSRFVVLAMAPTDERLSFCVREGGIDTLHEGILGENRTFSVTYRSRPRAVG